MNEQQRANLLVLAQYLESLPPDYEHFSMYLFTDHHGDCLINEAEMIVKRPHEFYNNCGTIACAAGHGPAAGFLIREDEYETETMLSGSKSIREIDWDAYTQRVFGIAFESPEFLFLFGGDWSSVDDHHYGAAGRIRYFLEHGVPEESDEMLISSWVKDLYSGYVKELADG